MGIFERIGLVMSEAHRLKDSTKLQRMPNLPLLSTWPVMKQPIEVPTAS